MNATPVLEIEKLRKTYSEGWLFRKRFEALSGVSFRVERGEVFGLLGPNGAGKTTIIKILLGIAHKTSGEAKLLGRPAGHPASRRQVGYLPEHLRIAPHHNAWTALELFGRLSGCSKRQIRQRGGELLEQVGLAHRAKDRLGKYSKGMLQRLGLAQALLHDPQLLILDEPTDGLDPVGRKHVRTFLGRLKEQGKTVFLNSHLLQEVELICDRVAILDRGHLRELAQISDLISRSRKEVVFDVFGEREVVERVLAGLAIGELHQRPPDGVRFTLLAEDQIELDQAVDRLRAAGLSIASMAVRKVSLEDAFMQIVHGGQPHASPGLQDVLEPRAL